MAAVFERHIEIVQGAGREGEDCRHRIRVQDVAIWHEKLGMSADEIVHHYPTLTLADVYAALAYYWDHRDDIERTIAEEDALVEELRRDYVGPLQRRLTQFERA